MTEGINIKKRLKLTASLLFCGALLLTGCGTPATSLPSELVGKTGDYSKSINIIAPDFFKGTGAANADQAMQQWLDEISERYGVKLNFTQNNHPGTSENTSPSASTLAEDNSFTGIVSINSINELKMEIDGTEIFDSLMPLDSYLENNMIWNFLPEDFKSLFEVDGHIYAIPTSVSRNLNARIIRNGALQETGIAVTDLDTLRDFAIAYEQKTGNAAGKTIYPTEVTDILNTFGLYPGNDEHTPFSYDPTEDCIVDWLTKPEAVEALEYLRELYNAGGMYFGIDLAKIQATFDSGIFPSAYEPYFDYETCTEVLTLNSKYPQVVFTTVSGFAMTSGTPQPQETINFLVDMLFGSEQSYLQFWLGSSKNFTVNSDGTITIEMAQDSAGNYVPPCMPNLAGELSDIYPYSSADLLYSKNGVVTTESKTASEKGNDYAKLLNELLENGTAVEIPPEYQVIESATYYANVNIPSAENNINGLYFGYFSKAIKRNDFTVQQIVDEYKEKFLSLGANQMLDEMNAAIGKQTAYYYG